MFSPSGTGRPPDLGPRVAGDLAVPRGRSGGVRRTLVLVVIVVLAGAASFGAWLATRSSGAVTALCASPPATLKERSIPKGGMTEATVVLTNFRFGRLDDFDGLASRLRWPPHGIMVAVSNDGPDSTPRFQRELRVTAANFQGFEGLRWPAANVAIRSRGRVLNAYAEVRRVTPAVVATVNSALASVHACHA